MSRTTKNILKNKILIKKFKSLFSKFSLKEGLTFLFFLFLAVVFWVMQVFSQKLDIKYTIPIKYEALADTVIFDNPLPKEINLSLKDTGQNSIKYFSKKNDSLIINIADVLKQSENKRNLQGNDFELLLKSKLLSSSELTGYYPTHISFSYNKIDAKKVPVVFDGHLELDLGYQFESEITLIPDSVMIRGAKGTLDKIKVAHTTNDTLKNIKNSDNLVFNIQQKEGIEFIPDNIKLNVAIDQFIDKTLSVPIKCINVPEHVNVKLFPSEATITCYVGLKRYNNVSPSDFRVIVDYKDIVKTSGSKVAYTIKSYPQFVRLQRIDNQEVEYIIEE